MSSEVEALLTSADRLYGAYKELGFSGEPTIRVPMALWHQLNTRLMVELGHMLVATNEGYKPDPIFPWFMLCGVRYEGDSGYDDHVYQLKAAGMI